MTSPTAVAADPVAVARRYLERRRPEVRALPGRLADPAAGLGRLGEAFCREVADHFADQPRRSWSADLDRRYALLRAETRWQFDVIERSGIQVEPWLDAGQPYRDAEQLCVGVRDTGILYVFLSRVGHGPVGTGGGRYPVDHPLRIGSGVVRNGVEFEYNDLLRAVHDFFGHVMFDNGMSLDGEFRAAYCNLLTYPDQVRPVVFAEQLSQVCWFFCGSHLRTADGRLPGRDEPGWLPPARRPYPEQKVFSCPPSFLHRFTASFEEAAA
ncbi:MAG TPA: crotonobetainyl-CoA--carnitine CoA-transferase [Jatrophihabitans sp.]|nr:crotonobetainyl-CoA--carnitine CoA-transferase [Jatrophihabitans sp.]